MKFSRNLYILILFSALARADYHPTISTGVTVAGDVVDGSQGDQHVYGVLTDSTIASQSAWSDIASGGQTDNILVTQQGTLFLEPGSQADHTQVTDGGMLQINGVSRNAYVENGGEIYINAGKNGVENALQGGQAIDTTVGAGGVMINRYGVDANTRVEAGGELDTGWDYPYEIRNTALSRNAIIESGGVQRVTNGGTSAGSLVNADGSLIVSGTWHYDVVTDEQPSAWYRGTALNSTVYGAMQNLGGFDQNTTVAAGGQYLLDGGGIAHKLTVDQGGRAQIHHGQLEDFWLYGLMNVGPEATLSGNGEVGDGGELTLNEGAQTNTLDLTLAGTLTLQNRGDNAPHDYQLNDVALNEGAIWFDPASFSTLTMTTLSGCGYFIIHTDIADQQGDFLNVTGTANGDFGVWIKDTGESPADARSLQIIHTGGGDAQFTLLNPDQQVDIGTWEYALTPDGQGNWALTPESTPTPSTEAVLAMANVTPTIFHSEIRPLQNRLDAVRSRPHDGEIWSAALSNRVDVKRTGNAAYRQRLGGLVIGYDASRTLNGGVVTWGVAGSYSRSSLDLTNNGDGSVDSYSAALYASYYATNRFWLDGMLKSNLFNQHLNARMSSGGHADGSYTTPGVGGSLSAGYDLRLENLTLSPFIGFSAFITQSDDYRLSNGMQAQPGVAKSALAQGGLRLSQQFMTRQGWRLTPWLKVALEQELAHSNPVRVNDDRFNNDIAGTRGSYQAGVSAALTRQMRLSATVQYQKGEGMESPWTGELGFSYTF
ncbi:autotransporter outer membrane beta-barrel domain-containing protein [Salmonella enterica]|nr:autotransporter outer membrane beta-barrel domain-containing protein [Salmonella enterica]ECI4982554.1 autotransporter outer membrane beta-barrel domain-containing protein [Salmonella enterica subsp. salamae]EHJ5090874.1 autotransporter outer membrane beta-barrel domain-containing protein [Salmonella enterica subsp. salamae serovar 16:m,t:-]EAV1732118.1 autotransporter outer membrane beta-barrel domain-containing protein [Salmonella enterica]EBK3132728.1 autotransporter outer membrane beta-b